MAIKRIVSTSFWTDSKIEKMTSDEKYLFLYLLTNPYTTQLGIYEIPLNLSSQHLGWDVEKLMNIISKLEQYGVILYSEDTSEIAIKNYLTHSIIKGGKPVFDCLMKEKKKVKNEKLLHYICESLSGKKEELNKTVVEFLGVLNGTSIQESDFKRNTKNRFNNFHQRKYDMQKLEAQLLLGGNNNNKLKIK